MNFFFFFTLIMLWGWYISTTALWYGFRAYSSSQIFYLNSLWTWCKVLIQDVILDALRLPSLLKPLLFSAGYIYIFTGVGWWFDESCVRGHSWMCFISYPKILETEVEQTSLNICVLPSKTQHMYISTVMKHKLHQDYMSRPWNSLHQVNAEHIQGTT